MKEEGRPACHRGASVVMALIIMALLTSLITLTSCAREAVSAPEEIPETPTEEAEGTEQPPEPPEEIDYSQEQFGVEFDTRLPSFLVIGSEQVFKIKVVNKSSFTWYSGGANPVRLGYHFYKQDEDFQVYDDGTRGYLAENVAPGQSTVIELPIKPPDRSGYYIIQLDMVVEDFSWFSAQGAQVHEAFVFVGK
ncbi:hypothetical protein HKBW3S03_01414 [Candidatus Hakubella thermalkaliphila]|uniref:Uncharacterized protein n=2 Tax=Candidatus Hakubella thermalkaliphila TaxID=2754717 RepID=A0A6V8PCA3_9ACTN|nr:hypothetical protein HKBW3S03_01414 [Candidatus Hakubella thermalkaliphila]GFP22900.1 hypothetical protein HKBW3S09_00367 [Candidatus Hakubella thermalkaliphila]GFP30312.1 hypothetical protein HKBW3S34_01233 [Candidatus Hakubella thermalkaliphila]GFP36418.1 hypothetical protein HKBW3S44_00101 [Candidatus Hakubella thermalkaliphila]GFP38709.1 hypothetical protein HKBW3S47_00410 [Candidatus Hakubella thermalkaliphila]